MRPQTLSRLIGIVVVTNLLTQIAIIVTGGAVRLTGSGLGCSSWPNCEPGEFSPSFHQATSIHPYVEFGNRVFGAVVVIVALALALLVWWAARSEHGPRPAPTARYRRLAVVPVVLSVAQAVLGGMTVRYELHPALVGSHFLISAVLVWISAWLVAGWFRPGSPQPLVPQRLRTLGWLLAALVGVVVILGMIVTGAGPHSGDSEVGYRFAVDPVLVARLHAGSVWVFLALVAAFVVLVHRARSAASDSPHLRRLRRWSLVLVAVTLAQGGIGYVQYFTGLPEILVGLHMLGAGLLVATTAFTIAALSARDVR
ncbi:COX15/CtaA family protein [Ruania halotolerans]|uniref:COX15/CtaA family protein n=1 Tax=Ruania halotolerans TaxID=2897773 RepID=UPI001E432751|nr:COX15/CtaA family protein [Ruania halotolerans]UFU05048.1 COX15/CtaA family protein [Ruania halotolerans]